MNTIGYIHDTSEEIKVNHNNKKNLKYKTYRNKENKAVNYKISGNILLW